MTGIIFVIAFAHVETWKSEAIVSQSHEILQDGMF